MHFIICSHFIETFNHPLIYLYFKKKKSYSLIPGLESKVCTFLASKVGCFVLTES